MQKKLDRLYLSTPDQLRIVDHKKKKTIVVHKEGQVDAGNYKFRFVNIHRHRHSHTETDCFSSTNDGSLVITMCSGVESMG